MINFSVSFPMRPIAALLSFVAVMVFVIGVTNSGFAGPMPRNFSLPLYAQETQAPPKNGYAKKTPDAEKTHPWNGDLNRFNGDLNRFNGGDFLNR